MSFDKCIIEVQNAVGRNLTKEELDSVSKEVSGLMKKLDAEGRLDEIDKEIAKRSEDIKRAALIEKRNEALNRIAQIELEDYIVSRWSDEPGLGLEGILVGVLKGARQGSRNSVASTQGSLFAKHVMGLVADMEEKGIHSMFVSGSMDRDIWRAIHAIDGVGEIDKSKIMPQAMEAAAIIKKHSEGLRVLANQYGADIKSLPGWLMKQTHDAGRIYRDKEGWIEFVDKNISWERSFPEAYSDEVKKEILEELYVTLASGVHVVTSDSPPSGFKGFGNIGKKMSRDRTIHFENADAEFEYNQQFGAGKITEGVIYGIEKMAQDIGILRRLGPNAQQNLDKVMENMLVRVKAEGDPKKLQKVNEQFESSMRRFWPHLNGMARVPGNAMLADISQGVRSFQMMSKLGGAVLSGISDVPSYASEVRYQGGNMLSGMAEALTSLTDNVPKKDRARLMGMLGVVHDGMISGVTKRFDASDSKPGQMAKITSLFFKFSGLRLWTDQLRTGFAKARSHDLAMNSGKEWSGLPEDMQRVLSLYDLDKKKWSVLQKAVEKGDDGRLYMTPESIRLASDDDIAAIIKNPNPTKIRNMRQEIEDQFRSYFYDRSTTAVIEPDAKTRGYMFGNTRPGTVDGEVMRHIMLFKSFTFSILQRVVGREVYGKGAMTMKEALSNGNGEMIGLANLMVWNMAFGYLAMSAKDIAKNRTPRDPMSYKTFLAAAAQGGGFGIYGDFIFGDLKNRYGGSAVSTLAGPTAGTVDDIVDIFQRVRDGDDAAAKTFKTLVNNTPFMNLFYTRWAMDYLILNQISESMSPGYLKRAERRIEQNNDQTLLFPQTP